MMDTPLQSGLPIGTLDPMGRVPCWDVDPMRPVMPYSPPLVRLLLSTYCSSGNAHPNVTAIHPSC
jgi:hypothetical protein